MGDFTLLSARSKGIAGMWPAALAWAAGWLALVLMDGRVDPDNAVVELGTRVQI